MYARKLTSNACLGRELVGPTFYGQSTNLPDWSQNGQERFSPECGKLSCCPCVVARFSLMGLCCSGDALSSTRRTHVT